MTLVSRAISSELLHARVPTRSFFARFNATSLSDRVRRVGRARTVGAVHDDPSLDESQANALAVNAHPATDRPHRDARSGGRTASAFSSRQSPGRRLGTLRRRRCENTVARWMPYRSARDLTLIPAR